MNKSTDGDKNEKKSEPKPVIGGVFEEEHNGVKSKNKK